jgi:histidinol-phosphate aminotransferase
MTLLQHLHHHTYATSQRLAVDLTLSENPLGPSPEVIEAIIYAAGKVHLYPQEEDALISLIAEHHDIAKESILLGAGANQILHDYLKVLALGKELVIPTATFPESVACMATLKGQVKKIPLDSNMRIDLEGLLSACTARTGCIHICNPNNPTGIWIEPHHLLQLASQSSVPLLISEAGADFVRKTMIQRNLPSNVIIVRSFSKGYGLASLRIGYSVASPEIIALMKKNLHSYRVSSIAIAAARAALHDQNHLGRSITYILQEKAWLMNEMRSLGFIIIPSHGQNFIAKVPGQFNTADNFCAILKQYGAAVVNCSLYPGLHEYIRISPQKHETNKKLILILKQIMESK